MKEALGCVQSLGNLSELDFVDAVVRLLGMNRNKEVDLLHKCHLRMK